MIQIQRSKDSFFLENCRGADASVKVLLRDFHNEEIFDLQTNSTKRTNLFGIYF